MSSDRTFLVLRWTHKTRSRYEIGFCARRAGFYFFFGGVYWMSLSSAMNLPACFGLSLLSLGFLSATEISFCYTSIISHSTKFVK
jgi:hypothetical protein